MLTYKYLLPLLALCFLIDELYAFLLPDRLRLGRSSHRLSRDVSPHLAELSDLSIFIPDNGGEMTQDWEPNPVKSHTPLLLPVEHISAPLPTTNRQKNKDKSRVRVTVPLDRIGNSYLSSRNRKDEPEDQVEYFDN